MCQGSGPVVPSPPPLQMGRVPFAGPRCWLIAVLKPDMADFLAQTHETAPLVFTESV